MDNSEVLNVELRTSTRKGDNNSLKRNGFLLGNITGRDVESVAIAVKKDEFLKTIKKLGRNSVLKLVVPDGQKFTVMVKDIDVRSVKNEIYHLNFQIVSLTETLKQDVAIKIIGSELLESKKLLISSSVDSVLVEGLPQNIPDEIVIDVSDLEAGDSILFSDMKLPKGITSSFDPDQKIVTVSGSKIIEEVVSESEEEPEGEKAEKQ